MITYKDVLGDALLCFGATSVSMDHNQNDDAQTIDEVLLCYAIAFKFSIILGAR